MLPVALAVLAAVLVGFYIVSYRDSVNNGAGLVKVLVASRDIPVGTAGSRSPVAATKTEIVPRRAVVTGSVVTAPLTSRVVTNEIFKGEQLLRQFAPAEQGGIFARFLGGKERAISVGRAAAAARRHAVRRRPRRRRCHRTLQGRWRPRDHPCRAARPPRAQGTRRGQDTMLTASARHSS